ncbi:MAG: Uma2 family endonuclease [Chloroflexota bacterium]|nr:Uma2 family endonuclease [Chloroflexota bacterium]
MAIAERLITVDEFEQIAALPENRDRLLELIDGVIEEKGMPTEPHSIADGNIYAALRRFVIARELGRVHIEVRYCRPDDQKNARIPDVSYSSEERPLVERGSVPEIPDIVVEIQSPDDRLKKLRNRIQWFLDNGAKLGWLLIPKSRLIEVYDGEDVVILTDKDILSGGDVLPGFEIPVKTVFDDPFKFGGRKTAQVKSEE